jgi:hypothetical protein
VAVQCADGDEGEVFFGVVAALLQEGSQALHDLVIPATGGLNVRNNMLVPRSAETGIKVRSFLGLKPHCFRKGVGPFTISSYLQERRQELNVSDNM